MHVQLAALAIPLVLGSVALVHAPRPVEKPTDWTRAVAFEEVPLPAAAGPVAAIRKVHPGLDHIAGWISAVGASVALFDRDGDGLNNDYCLVDPRHDSVTVAPVPGTGARFAPEQIAWSDGGADPGSVAPMGCLPADFDADGKTDLILYYWGREPTLHLAAEGYAGRSLLGGHELWHSNAAIVTDIDGDGALDLVFGNYFPDSYEVLGTAGTARMQRSMSRAMNAGRNRMFLGDGHGGFRDVSAALDAAAPNGWTLGLGAADMDGDGLPELYVANDFGHDQLLHNESRIGAPAFAAVTGRRHLTDTRSRVLGQDSFKGMGIDFGDIDRDGRLDMYVSSIAEDHALMESHLLFRGLDDPSAWSRGRAPFEEVSGRLGLSRSGWGWDARFADFDGDGWPEVLQATGFLHGDTDRWPELHEVAMGNDELLQFPAAWADFGPGADLSGDRPDALFQRGPDGSWHDTGRAHGFGPSVSRGIALGDVDGDGDVDALIARQWQDSVLLRNVSPGAAARSATLVPVLHLPDGTRRAAYGASVLLTADRPDLPRAASVVPSGEGHSGKSAPEVTFGLGGYPAGTRLSAEITWRDASGLHHATVPVAPGRQIVELEPALTVQPQIPLPQTLQPQTGTEN